MNILLGALALASFVVAIVFVYLWRHVERVKESYWHNYQAATRRLSAAEHQATELAVAVRGVLDLDDGAAIYRSFLAWARLKLGDALVRAVWPDRELADP